MRARRQFVASALIAVGAIGLVLTALVLVYPAWAEWQAHREQGNGPAEVLPEQLAVTPEDSAGQTDPPSAPAAADQPAADSPALAEVSSPGPPSPDAADPLSSETISPVDPAAPAPPETLSRDAQPPTPAAPIATAEADLPTADDAPTEAEPEPAEPSPTTAPTAPETAGYGRAVWITIPRIGVDSRVVEVSVLADGEFQAPSFSVGHHVSSPDPGEPGNSVFAGHLTSINAGRVFARLRELRPGDAVYLYSPGYRLDWRVVGVRTVPNTDTSFIFPAGDTRITLYTCAGQFLPLSRDYSHRLVVTARLVRAVPRA